MKKLYITIAVLLLALSVCLLVININHLAIALETLPYCLTCH